MTSRCQPRSKSDWRLTVRFRYGAEDDLIEYLRTVPSGRRATLIREAIRQAVQSGLTYNGHFSQGPQRHRPDLRVTVRFHRGEDDCAITHLQSLPSRKKSAYVWQSPSSRLFESIRELFTDSRYALVQVGHPTPRETARGPADLDRNTSMLEQSLQQVEQVYRGMAALKRGLCPLVSPVAYYVQDRRRVDRRTRQPERDTFSGYTQWLSFITSGRKIIGWRIIPWEGRYSLNSPRVTIGAGVRPVSVSLYTPVRISPVSLITPVCSTT